MMKWIILLSTLIIFELSSKGLDNSTSAGSVIVINADTGAVIYEKNAHIPQYPASLTKIATCAYTLKIAEDKLNRMITAERDSVVSISEEELKRSNYTLPSYWLVPGTSHIGIKVGEKLSIEDLLHGMMLASGGDACNVIGQYLGGTVPVFMEDINDYLGEIGCKNTYFMNPHGLHHPKHVTTAYDLAILTREAMQNPTFRKIVKAVRYTRPKTNLQQQTTLVQTNRLLRKGKLYYSKAIGVKTGYTSMAKNCLAAAAEHEGRTLIVILLKNNDRETMFKDARKIFETVFKEKKETKVYMKAGQRKPALMLSGADKYLRTYSEEGFELSYYPSEKPQLKCFLQWEDLELPIQKGQCVGEMLFQNDQNQTVKRIPLLARDEVNWSFSVKLRQFFNRNTLLKMLGGILAFVLLAGLALQIRRN